MLDDAWSDEPPSASMVRRAGRRPSDFGDAAIGDGDVAGRRRPVPSTTCPFVISRSCIVRR
jgi:hypothetical protein